MRNALVHWIPDPFQQLFVHKGFEGFVKHGRCAEDNESQGVVWVSQVKGRLKNSIVPSNLQ